MLGTSNDRCAASYLYDSEIIEISGSLDRATEAAYGNYPYTERPMTSSKTERVDLRLAPENKDLLQEAATALGTTVTAFILDVAMAAARRVRDEQEERLLSERDRRAFLQMLDQNPQPNAALTSAYAAVKAARGE